MQKEAKASGGLRFNANNLSARGEKQPKSAN